MKSTLVFDYDGSLASIGGEAKLLQTFGIRPIRIHKGLEQTKSVIKKLTKPIQKAIDHPLLDDVAVLEEGYELSQKSKELNLDCLVFDTVTAMGLQERNQIKLRRNIETMDQRGWGVYGDSMNSFIYSICSLPVKTIFNAHIDRDREAGETVLELPSIKGSSKVEIQKWFDVILFTRVSTDPKTKESKFYWQTKPSEGRYAKDRLGILPSSIPQNFQLIFDEYEKAGIKHPNILVLGDSGTGKSKALSSLVYNPNHINSLAA